MKDTLYKALLVFVALVPATTNADEDRPSDSAPAALAASHQALDTLLDDAKYAPRWQLLQPVEPTGFVDNWSNPMSSIRFQDASTMARVTRMRKLSLLTLARTGQARLFLGVNEKGVLGVHFSALALRGNDDYVELARMPYLPSASAEESQDEAN